MNTQNNASKDFTLGAYAITFALALCFTVLPFSGEIWTDIVGDSQMNKALEINNARYDMSQAEMQVFDVDNFTIIELPNGDHDVWLDGVDFTNGESVRVESELDEQSMAELFYQKEEIVIRVAANNRISIIRGDNEGF